MSNSHISDNLSIPPLVPSLEHESSIPPIVSPAQAEEQIKHPLAKFDSDPLIDFIMESCPFKAAVGGIMSTIFGFGIGAFFSLNSNPAIETEGKGFGKQLAESFKQSGRQGYKTAKGFGLVGLLFAGTECVIETYRGKTDMKNTLGAGCASGAVLGIRGGVRSAVFGCVGFSAFSAAIDHFTGRHDSSMIFTHEDDTEQD